MPIYLGIIRTKNSSHRTIKKFSRIAVNLEYVLQNPQSYGFRREGKTKKSKTQNFLTFWFFQTILKFLSSQAEPSDMPLVEIHYTTQNFKEKLSFVAVKDTRGISPKNNYLKYKLN